MLIYVGPAVAPLHQTSDLPHSINIENINWPELPKPAVQTTVKPASYPGQQSVAVYNCRHKQLDSTETRIKVPSTALNPTTQKPTTQCVHFSARQMSSKTNIKSKLSLPNKSTKLHVKQCDVNSCDISLSNRFSILQSHEVDNDDDDDDHHGTKHNVKQKSATVAR